MELIAKDNRPILLWKHDLQPGAEITFDRPGYDHCLYLLDGSLSVNGDAAGKGGVVVVEHDSDAALRAGGEGASILHFHRPMVTRKNRPGWAVTCMSSRPKASLSVIIRRSGIRARFLPGSDCESMSSSKWLARLKAYA